MVFCRKHAAEMLNLLDDMETLLQTDIHFLMGRWISDARATGNTSYFSSWSNGQKIGQIVGTRPNFLWQILDPPLTILEKLVLVKWGL